MWKYGSSNSTSTSTLGLLVNQLYRRQTERLAGRQVDRQAGRQVGEPHEDRAVDYLVLFSGIGTGDTRMNMDEKLHGGVLYCC